ncbi:RHS repeat-associated core domain-containing protein [Paraflavisolibacter sp. H34]|uniref:RHS repeat domain-containing protein n=1 Tax=Huijunlia imazamoxiresistens TaxID=3127457 RepID=UPI0030177CF4
MVPLTMRNALAVLLCLLLSFLGLGQEPEGATGKTIQKPLAAADQKRHALVDSLVKLMALPPFEHPVLRAIYKEQTGNLALFSNYTPNALVVACAIEQPSRIAYFFTCFGKVTDFVLLNEEEYKSIVGEKKRDVFEFYSAYQQFYIDQVDQAGRELQLYGAEAAKRENRSPYFNNPVVQQAGTPLEKLLVLDRCRQEMIQQLVNVRHEIMVYDLADSVRRALHSPAFKAGVFRTGGAADSARWGEYFNQNPFCSVEKAVVSGEKGLVFLYDKSCVIDSFPVKKDGVSKMLSSKTNPFVLYRGWLEWQLQELAVYLDSIRIKLENTAEAPMQRASSIDKGQQFRQWRQAVQWQRHLHESISRLLLPHEGMMAVQETMDGARTWGRRQLRWIGGERFHKLVGQKRFELTDHLGNVVVVVTDRSTGIDRNGDGQVEYYEPEIISAIDYAPFGTQMAGRSFNKDEYRFGFNGKENDGETGMQDYGMRIYDPRLGRFLSTDPLIKDFPWYSTYQFAGGNPIKNLDLDGGEPLDYRERWVDQTIESIRGGSSTWEAYSDNKQLGFIAYTAVFDKVTERCWFVHRGNDGQYYYWKHNPGANQMEYISSNREGKSNGVWEKFETRNKIEARKILNDRSFEKIMAGSLIALPAIAALFPAATAAISSIPSASVGERMLSVGVDYGAQVVGNYLSGKSLTETFTDINATSLVFAGLNSGSTWKRLAFNNVVSNGFSFSTSVGYNGVGGGKSITTAAIQFVVGTLAGRATRGIDLKGQSLAARFNHVNSLMGKGSPLSASLQKMIKTNQGVGVGVSVTTGGVGNGLANYTEKPP